MRTWNPPSTGHLNAVPKKPLQDKPVKKPARTGHSLLLIALVAVCGVSVVIWLSRKPRRTEISGGPDAELIRALVTSEETYLKLDAKMAALSRACVIR